MKRLLQSKATPWLFALAAAAMMIPALKTGLMVDDLVQRVPQLEPSQIPPDLLNTGLVPDNPGTLSTVLFETFGFLRNKAHAAIMRNYGIFPWWFPDDVKVSLWRPFTACTHWLDYRLFPDSPVLMHAHNIAWFAAVVVLVAFLYRRMLFPAGLAALAALMFVLDKNTYFPVMFVANRGFIISLCLGLLCFWMHYHWRTKNSPLVAVLSVLFFSLSLLSNEAGVSTFAFLLAYALTLDNASWPKRLLSLLPAVLTIIAWRIVYQSLGYGVAGIGAGYIDPGQEPIKFLVTIPGYALAVIAAQLSGIAPDAALGLNVRYFPIFSAFYLAFFVIAMILLLPLVRRNKTARFFFLLMLLAAIPAATAPSGKNFGFVSIGAFGLIAIFVAALIQKTDALPSSRRYRIPAWIFCVILLVTHIPQAAVSKLAATKITPTIFGALEKPADLSDLAIANDSNLVLVNAPSLLGAWVIPYYAAYHEQTIPHSMRVLAFACTALDVKRIDEYTLEITSRQKNIFTANPDSILHFSHAFAMLDRLFYNPQVFEVNRTYTMNGWAMEVLDLDDEHLPKKLSVTFDAPLQNESFLWLQFDWRTFTYKPFPLPAIGETVTTDAPHKVPWKRAVRSILSPPRN